MYLVNGQPARSVSVTLQHFNLDDGFEVPLLDGILRESDHVSRHLIKLSSSDATYIVFVCAKPPDRSRRLQRRHEPNAQWDGEMLILRHAKSKQGFINLTTRDRRLVPYIVLQ